MKVSRSAMCLVVGLASSTSSYGGVHAFSAVRSMGTTTTTTASRTNMFGTTTIIPRHLLQSGASSSSNSNILRSNNNKNTMTMMFGTWFGGGGNGNGSTSNGSGRGGIAYEALDHPGPELASAAKAGTVLVTSPRDPNLAVATFAGGCFWGLELAYQRVPGVVYTAVGYTQGPELEPTYTQVCSGSTGHTEAVVVYYNPTECSYDALLDTFFGRVNPTTVNGQGNDFGTQYRTGVYYHSPDQEQAARARFTEVASKYNRPMATELKAAMPFWPAEKYHQQYLEKYVLYTGRYCFGLGLGF
jgi:peptide-methionine (S)-S-oxide reductase